MSQNNNKKNMTRFIQIRNENFKQYFSERNSKHKTQKYQPSCNVALNKVRKIILLHKPVSKTL